MLCRVLSVKRKVFCVRCWVLDVVLGVMLTFKLVELKSEFQEQLVFQKPKPPAAKAVRKVKDCVGC